MPYGMTQSAWAQRISRWDENPIIQTTDCPRCSIGAGTTCVTARGNHTYDVHLFRIQDYVAKWITRHTPDGQPL